MCLSSLSCYETQEGCLDLNASNYDFEADDDCDDCCRYPTLSLGITQLYNGESFRLGDTLENSMNQQFRLLDYLYILSDVTLYTPSGGVKILDTIKLTDDTFIYNDILKVERSRFRNDVGNFIYNGKVDSISLHYGLPQVSENIANKEHLLNAKRDSLYRNEDYVIHRLKLGLGSTLQDTVTIEIPSRYGSQLFNLDFQEEVYAKKGFSLQLMLEADYGRWFKDVNFDDTEEEIAKQIFINSSSFIY